MMREREWKARPSSAETRQRLSSTASAATLVSRRMASGQAADIPFRVNDTRRVQDAVRRPVEVAPDRFDVKMIRWATPSPDGSRVVFEALGNLWIRDLPTGQEAMARQTAQGLWANGAGAPPAWRARN